MISEAKLRETLIILAENMKTQQEVLSDALDEIAALRETVRGLDPTFEDFCRNRKADVSGADFRRQALMIYDDLILLLKAGVIC